MGCPVGKMTKNLRQGNEQAAIHKLMQMREVVRSAAARRKVR